MSTSRTITPGRAFRRLSGSRGMAVGTKIFMWAFLLLMSMIWIFPFLVVLLTAFRTQADLINLGVFSWPRQWSLRNFEDSWGMGNFIIYYRNTVVLAFTKVPVGLLVTSMLAYPLAKFRFRLREAVFLVILLGLAIPQVVTVIPLAVLLKKMRLLDSLGALFFPYIALGVPFQTLVFRGFFRNIPNEFIDAGRVDGLSEFSIYRSIILPLSGAVLAALAIIDFLGVWNEFLLALLFVHSEQ
jgi:raffinose/stachyose/melibiose transport system permease protein